jgi:hypothetical protein
MMKQIREAVGVFDGLAVIYSVSLQYVPGNEKDTVDVIALASFSDVNAGPWH